MKYIAFLFVFGTILTFSSCITPQQFEAALEEPVPHHEAPHHEEHHPEPPPPPEHHEPEPPRPSEHHEPEPQHEDIPIVVSGHSAPFQNR